MDDSVIVRYIISIRQCFISVFYPIDTLQIIMGEDGFKPNNRNKTYLILSKVQQSNLSLRYTPVYGHLALPFGVRVHEVRLHFIHNINTI